MAGSSQPLTVTKGKQVRSYVALLGTGVRDEPNAVTLTLTAGAAKGATALTVTSVTTTIKAGQWLLFEDADEKVYKAQVSADYATGTSVSVYALAEAIPNASAAAFPAPFKLRTSNGVSFKQNVQDINTCDHDVNGDATPGSATFEGTFEGEYSSYDPGYATAVYATQNTLECYIWRELPVPGSGYTKGKVTHGAAIITARDEPAPNEGNVSANVTVRFVGDVTEEDPTPS